MEPTENLEPAWTPEPPVQNVDPYGWIPQGFYTVPGADGLAASFPEADGFNCSSPSGVSCWNVVVYSRDGCASGVAVTIKMFDRIGNPIDTATGTTEAIPSDRYREVQVIKESAGEGGTSKLAALSCIS